MKKKNLLLLLASLLVLTPLVAQQTTPKDTIPAMLDLEEVVVVASPKETTKLRQSPAAVSLLSQKDLQGYQINSLKNISGIVPNFYMPDYGSRLTSAVYIRGIGARINTPAVGLYVDNVPYIDKSAFDFNYYDIERIDVLRGPQGTLYGRNTMGGLVKVHTRSPFSYQGTDLKLSAGTYNNYNASVTHYHRISRKFAFSAGGFYEYSGGYFDNEYVGEKADELSAGGGRIRAIWLPSDNLKVDLALGYEYTDQGGYAYGAYDKETGIAPVSYNDPSTYRRALFNTGLNVEYQAKHFVLSAVTGYQNLNDRMSLDQDFSTDDIFNITQKQKLNTLSEEIVLKSKSGGRWQWVSGVFGFYQWLNTDGPVTFKEDGLTKLIEEKVNTIFAGLPAPAPPMGLDITSDQLLTTGNFDTPVLNLAAYHQSTFNDLLVKGLSATVGLRLDYEKTTMKYNAGSNGLGYNFLVNGRPVIADIESTIPELKGKEQHDYVQLLPKLALKYDFNAANNVYASLSKGYRSGGYNVQMFSDVIQAELQYAMVNDLKSKAPPQMGALVPEMDGRLNIKETTNYKPEYSWNYELGAHLSFCNNRLTTDVALFYMDTRDQQIARFSPNGFGRMTVNAGKSRSFGAEIAAKAVVTRSFSLNGSYGYTNAKFTDYDLGKANGEGEQLTYDGKYVPMVPRHTLNVGGEYTFRLGHRYLVNQLSVNAYYAGAGEIYWTEANDISQDFYGTLNCRVSAQMKEMQIDLWVRNLLDESYTSFYFESLGNSFMQKGKPMHLGVDVRWKF